MKVAKVLKLCNLLTSTHNPMKVQSLLIAIIILLFLSLKGYCQAPDYPIAHPNGYVCYKTITPLNVDGSINEPVWDLTEWTHLFADITGNENKSPYLDTKVKMLWDDSYFYIAAELQEPHLWGTITEKDKVIFKDNDFEVFIDPNGDNHNYYELEMNALNTIWDLMLNKPYRDGGAAIDNYDFKGLLTAVTLFGTINNPHDVDDKWTIEIAIPWQNFEVWNPKQKHKTPHEGEQWRVNFSRVQWELEPDHYKYNKKLDFRRNVLPENNWVWSPQGIIQMHQPETWGYVQFSEKQVGSAIVEFKKDLDFNLKMALMDVYFQQKKYYKKHQTYASNIDELNLSEYTKIRFSKRIKIEKIRNQFVAYAEGYNGVWQIDENSKITSTPLKLETSF